MARRLCVGLRRLVKLTNASSRPMCRYHDANQSDMFLNSIQATGQARAVLGALLVSDYAVCSCTTLVDLRNTDQQPSGP